MSGFIKGVKCSLALMGICSDFMAEPFNHFRKEEGDSAGLFTSGGGRLPAWTVGMSIFATCISFLALPGKAFGSNWNAFVFSLSIPVAAIVAVKFFVPLYRSLNSVRPTVIWKRALALGRVYMLHSAIWSVRLPASGQSLICWLCP